MPKTNKLTKNSPLRSVKSDDLFQYGCCITSFISWMDCKISYLNHKYNLNNKLNHLLLCKVLIYQQWFYLFSESKQENCVKTILISVYLLSSELKNVLIF